MTRHSTASLVLLLLAAGCDTSVPHDHDRGWRANRQHLQGIALPGDADGVYWDAPTATLYIGSGADQLVAWTRDDGVRPVASTRSGAVVRLPDGRVATLSTGLAITDALPPMQAAAYDARSRRLFVVETHRLHVLALEGDEVAP